MLNIISTCWDILCVDINVDKRCVDHITIQYYFQLSPGGWECNGNILLWFFSFFFVFLLYFLFLFFIFYSFIYFFTEGHNTPEVQIWHQHFSKLAMFPHCGLRSLFWKPTFKQSTLNIWIQFFSNSIVISIYFISLQVMWMKFCVGFPLQEESWIRPSGDWEWRVSVNKKAEADQLWQEHTGIW